MPLKMKYLLAASEFASIVPSSGLTLAQSQIFSDTAVYAPNTCLEVLLVDI